MKEKFLSVVKEKKYLLADSIPPVSDKRWKRKYTLLYNMNVRILTKYLSMNSTPLVSKWISNQTIKSKWSVVEPTSRSKDGGKQFLIEWKKRKATIKQWWRNSLSIKRKNNNQTIRTNDQLLNHLMEIDLNKDGGEKSLLFD